MGWGSFRTSALFSPRSVNMSQETEKLNKSVELDEIKSKKAPKKWASVILLLIIGISLIAVVVFAVITFQTEKEYKAGNDYYESIRSDQLALAHIQYIAASSDNTLQEQPESEELAVTRKSQMDFSYLRTVNEDLVAWITAEGLPIDLPVVQGEDNDYYLTHRFDRELNRLGTLFVDMHNSPDFSDKNTVIYGHNMNDGSMFASLVNYKSQDFYNNFPTIDLFTLQGDYTIEIFAGQLADANNPFIQFDFKDDMDFMTYVTYLKVISTFESPVEVSTEDQIITLSTCTEDFNNARYVIYGRLVPKN